MNADEKKICERAVEKRKRIVESLHRIVQFTKTIDDETIVELISVQLEALNELMLEFRKIEDRIMAYPDQISEIIDFETQYYESKAMLQRQINHRKHGATSDNDHRLNQTMAEIALNQTTFLETIKATSSKSSDVKLPKINIQPFFGKYEEFPAFKDLFESSIHNNESISNAIKFQLLKGVLRDDAALLIKHLKCTALNYEEAWNKIVERYDKKKPIVANYIQRFLDISPVTRSNQLQFRTIHDTADEVIRGLRALGAEAERRDPWLVNILLSKLDIETRRLWSQKTLHNDFPSFESFVQFLGEHCDTIEGSELTSSITRRAIQPIKRIGVHHASHEPSTLNYKLINCEYCQNNHPLFKCFKFKKINVEERRNFLETNHLCKNCFSSSHETSSCQNPNRCFTCGNKHHTLIHQGNENCKTLKSNNSFNKTKLSSNYIGTIDSTIKKVNNSSSINKVNNSSTINNVPSINKATCINSSSTCQPMPRVVHTNLECDTSTPPKSSTHCCSTDDYSLQPIVSTHAGCPVNTLLSTAIFNIIDEFGNTHNARGLLDSGSQTTLISESCVNRIGLHRTRSRVTVSGLASQKAGVTKGEVKLHILSKVQPESSITVRALILPNLTSMLPTNKCDATRWPIIKHITLADPSFNIPSVIDIILGNDVFYEIIRSEKIKITDHLFAQSTIFGWVLGGKIASITAEDQPRSFHTTISNNEPEDLISRFWEIEEVSGSSVHDPVENECEIHYQQTTTRTNDGRYIVKLPFKLPRETLGSSYHEAVKRFLLLEKKFNSNEKLKQDYMEFINEYIALGHMEKLEIENNFNKFNVNYHLPHHCVIKDTSSTTKLRVVFDGSCRSTTGYSLNDMLAVGPIQSRMTLQRY